MMRRAAPLSVLAAGLLMTPAALAQPDGWTLGRQTDAGTGVETLTASVAGEDGARLVIACRNRLSTLMALLPGRPSAGGVAATATIGAVDLPVTLIDRGAATLVAATSPGPLPAIIETIGAADGPVTLTLADPGADPGSEPAVHAFTTQGAAGTLATFKNRCAAR